MELEFNPAHPYAYVGAHLARVLVSAVVCG